MNFIYRIFSATMALFLLAGCGAYFNQPLSEQDARTGELTPKSTVLKEFPLPQEPVVVGVYNFKDQTGQFKPTENGSTFSTAVSQGGTTMLVKALEDSKWFTPIERENLQNLLNERNIIRQTRDDYRKNQNPNEPTLPPLLYAGILLEGGVVSYDSNILTGGVGARYFGVGGSTQYRQDRLTIYLRAVSTSSGKILKTVYVSKTILSQAVDASLFRYVNFQRLLEVETGFTKNEPVQLAMKDAIEKAVESLIVEGIQGNLWKTKEGKEKDDELVKAYLDEKEMEESRLLYDRKQLDNNFKNSVSLTASTPLFSGDLEKKRFGYGGGLGYTRQVTNHLHIAAKGTYLQFEGGETFEDNFADIKLNLEGVILPYDDFSPYVYAGPGVLINFDERNNGNPNVEPALTLQYGLGVLFNFSERMGLRAFADHNLTFTDNIEKVINGKRDDYYFNFGLGIHFNFEKKKDNSIVKQLDRTLE